MAPTPQLSQMMEVCPVTWALNHLLLPICSPKCLLQIFVCIAITLLFIYYRCLSLQCIPFWSTIMKTHWHIFLQSKGFPSFTRFTLHKISCLLPGQRTFSGESFVINIFLDNFLTALKKGENCYSCDVSLFTFLAHKRKLQESFKASLCKIFP